MPCRARPKRAGPRSTQSRAQVTQSDPAPASHVERCDGRGISRGNSCGFARLARSVRVSCVFSRLICRLVIIAQCLGALAELAGWLPEAKLGHTRQLCPRASAVPTLSYFETRSRFELWASRAAPA